MKLRLLTKPASKSLSLLYQQPLRSQVSEKKAIPLLVQARSSAILLLDEVSAAINLINNGSDPLKSKPASQLAVNAQFIKPTSTPKQSIRTPIRISIYIQIKSVF
ncbi:MAG: hypothetical protein M0Q99_11620, partial [Candidatus Cloacimonetes bacterium]|nr:hypothetical protein [Candidatus Cloacimonadota bacterium]